MSLGKGGNHLGNQLSGDRILRRLLRHCARWPSGSPLLSQIQKLLLHFGPHNVGLILAGNRVCFSNSPYRVLAVDALENRELFAVMSALVFEDVNRSHTYDPQVDLPAAHQLAFVDLNGNHVFDTSEPTATSDRYGIVTFQVEFGVTGDIIALPRTQQGLYSSNLNDAIASTLETAQLAPLYAPLNAVAFDTVFQGEDQFDPSARLFGGSSDWLVVASHGEGEDDFVGDNGLKVFTTPLPENSNDSTEVGTILLYGETPPPEWTWSVSDDRFEIIGNKLMAKANSPIDFETEPKVVLVIEGSDNNALSSNPRQTTVTITVTNRNDPPSAIFIGGNSVLERLAGAIVGPVRVVDQDVSEPYQFSVSDQRFEIVGGMLKLRSDIALVQADDPYVDLTVSAQSLLDSTQEIELSVRIEVLVNSMPWTNGSSPLDVNGDGNVNATDALIVINRLNAQGPHQLSHFASSRSTKGTPDFVDVNGDGHIGAMDALIIINRLRHNSSMDSAASGEDAPNRPKKKR